jgi:hypothetical protein
MLANMYKKERQRMKSYCLGTLVIFLFTAAFLPAKAPAANPAQGCDADASPDTWGGRDISMEMTPQGATLQFDCAHGLVLEPIKANAKGDFIARGSYTPEHGGPISLANPPRDLPATYKGSIKGDTMRLQVVLADKDKDQSPDPYTLTRGKTGRVVRCR